MKFLAIQLLLIAVANGLSFFDVFYQEWKAFKLQHKKTYENKAEEILRMKIFIENKNKIAKHNQRYERGEESYRLAINKYSDMSHKEFINSMNGYKNHVKFNEYSHIEIQPATFIAPDNSTLDLPNKMDWRIKGAVTEVKDQSKTCMSCWAFSATGALEGQHFRKTRELVSLSEQNLLDCSGIGCERASMIDAFEYIFASGGIDNEKSYPYVAKKGSCLFNTRTWAATNVGYAEINGDEELLKIAVATVGPISIAIDATHDSFQTYSSGVYKNVPCNEKNINHAMLLVGYGTDERDGDYWLVKNSWGLTWGIEGYLKIARNKGNFCGIASYAMYPIV